MRRWWQVAAAVTSLALLGALNMPTESPAASSVAPSATAAAVSLKSMFAPAVLPKPAPSAQAVAHSSKLVQSIRVPKSQPTRLDIGGAHPIHAVVRSFNQLGGTSATLIPPGGNYRDAFFWRRGGLPGDNATHMSYILGHTFSGPTQGVFDYLKLVQPGAAVRLTTKTGQLRYCVTDRFTVDQQQLVKADRVWNPVFFNRPGDWLVLIACLTSKGDRWQTGRNIIVRAQRC